MTPELVAEKINKIYGAFTEKELLDVNNLSKLFDVLILHCIIDQIYHRASEKDKDKEITKIELEDLNNYIYNFIDDTVYLLDIPSLNKENAVSSLKGKVNQFLNLALSYRKARKNES